MNSFLGPLVGGIESLFSLIGVLFIAVILLVLALAGTLAYIFRDPIQTFFSNLF